MNTAYVTRLRLLLTTLVLVVLATAASADVDCFGLDLDGTRQVVSKQGSRQSGVLLNAEAYFFSENRFFFGVPVQATFHEKLSQNGRIVEGTITFTFTGTDSYGAPSPFTAADTLTFSYRQSLVAGTRDAYVGTFSIAGGTGVFANAVIMNDSPQGIPAISQTLAGRMAFQANDICFTAPAPVVVP